MEQLVSSSDFASTGWFLENLGERSDIYTYTRPMVFVPAWSRSRVQGTCIFTRDLCLHVLRRAVIGLFHAVFTDGPDTRQSQRTCALARSFELVQLPQNVPYGSTTLFLGESGDMYAYTRPMVFVPAWSRSRVQGTCIFTRDLCLHVLRRAVIGLFHAVFTDGPDTRQSQRTCALARSFELVQLPQNVPYGSR